MPLHPEAQAVVDSIPPAPPGPPVAIDVKAMRAGFAQAWAHGQLAPPVGRIVDRYLPGPGGEIAVRIYNPVGEGPFPALVWFHGGGWVIGSIDENDAACRALTSAASVVIVSVDYRLAPENPFPAAADDAFAIVSWLAAHGDEIGVVSDHLAVGGESAGGNLAAVVALMARDRGGPVLDLQLLVSPVLGHPGDGRASYADYAEGFFLSKSSMEWFFTQYPRSAADLENPYLLPLRADDLRRLPRALVLEAECDPLRDEGEEYARRLKDAGVHAELTTYPGQIHGFFGPLVGKLSISSEAHARAAGVLREAFGMS